MYIIQPFFHVGEIILTFSIFLSPLCNPWVSSLTRVSALGGSLAVCSLSMLIAFSLSSMFICENWKCQIEHENNKWKQYFQKDCKRKEMLRCISPTIPHVVVQQYFSYIKTAYCLVTNFWLQQGTYAMGSSWALCLQRAKSSTEWTPRCFNSLSSEEHVTIWSRVPQAIGYSHRGQMNVVHLSSSQKDYTHAYYCIQLWIRLVWFSSYTDLNLIRPILNSPTLQFSYIVILISFNWLSLTFAYRSKGENKTEAKFFLYTVFPA